MGVVDRDQSAIYYLPSAADADTAFVQSATLRANTTAAQLVFLVLISYFNQRLLGG